MVETTQKTAPWMLFVGVLLLLIGLYSASRTLINFFFFEKYPTYGVISLNFSGIPAYSQKEQDCFYPQIYYTADGRTVRDATEAEKESEKAQKDNCIEGVKEVRNSAKVNDISQSLLFLFLGAGLIISRKIFFK